MQKQIFFFLIISFFSLFFSAGNTEAKLLPQAAKLSKSGNAAAPVTSGIIVNPRFRSDRRAVILNFSGLQNASSVSYTLTYTQNNQEEGAIGTLNIKGSTASQELLFGTCSKNVCRYHTNLSNIKLEVLYTLKSGKKYVKRFKFNI